MCTMASLSLLCMLAGVPDVPARPTIRERARGVELRWSAVETTSAGGGGGGNDSGHDGPLLYIVDSRWNIGRQQNEADMTPWQQVAQVGYTRSPLSRQCCICLLYTSDAADE